MKHYPSITRVDLNTGWTEQELYTHAKYDGSMIRYGYSRSKGFYKFGSRKQLLDPNDPILGPAIPLFMETLSEPLTKIARDNKWDNIIVFAEYWGANSIAGRHVAGDKMHLTLFDVALRLRGIMSPKDFLKHFSHLPIAQFLGVKLWTKEFVQAVRNNEIELPTIEGIVGKCDYILEPFMLKCKTNKWLDAVKKLYSQEEAERIINS